MNLYDHIWLIYGHIKSYQTLYLLIWPDMSTLSQFSYQVISENFFFERVNFLNYNNNFKLCNKKSNNSEVIIEKKRINFDKSGVKLLEVYRIKPHSHLITPCQ